MSDGSLSFLAAVCFVTLFGLLVIFVRGCFAGKEKERAEDTPTPDLERKIEDSVEKFTGHMVEKLHANSNKGHWSVLAFAYLLNRLKEETKELEKAIDNLYTVDGLTSEKIEDICKEAADVANFAMMISDNAERIER